MRTRVRTCVCGCLFVCVYVGDCARVSVNVIIGSSLEVLNAPVLTHESMCRG